MRPKPKSYTVQEAVEKRARQAARAIRAKGATPENLARILAAGNASREIATAYLGPQHLKAFIDQLTAREAAVEAEAELVAALDVTAAQETEAA